MKAIEYLIPPPTAAGPEVIRWRISVMCACMLFGVHVMWACGLLPGLNGFAMAAEVQEIERDVTAIRRELLEARIFDTRVKQCTAESVAARRFYAEKQRDLINGYIDLTGREPALPGCRELI